MSGKDVQEFLEEWTHDPRGVRPVFQALAEYLKERGAVTELKVRPEVSISLRAGLAEQKVRPLFCLVDVVEDAEGRWLSVCFYAQAVTDPEERGDVVPQGLLGEDGYCFDVDSPDPELDRYLKPRIEESVRFARNQG